MPKILGSRAHLKNFNGAIRSIQEEIVKLAHRIRGRRDSVIVRQYGNSPWKVTTTLNKCAKTGDKQGAHTEFNKTLNISPHTWAPAKVFYFRSFTVRNFSKLKVQICDLKPFMGLGAQ